MTLNKDLIITVFIRFVYLCTLQLPRIPGRISSSAASIVLQLLLVTCSKDKIASISLFIVVVNGFYVNVVLG
jgi:hypothetical protein